MAIHLLLAITVDEQIQASVGFYMFQKEEPDVFVLEFQYGLQSCCFFFMCKLMESPYQK